MLATEVLHLTNKCVDNKNSVDFEIDWFACNCSFCLFNKSDSTLRFNKLSETKSSQAITTITIYAHFLWQRITVTSFIQGLGRMYEVCSCSSVAVYPTKGLNLSLWNKFTFKVNINKLTQYYSDVGGRWQWCPGYRLLYNRARPVTLTLLASITESISFN